MIKTTASIIKQQGGISLLLFITLLFGTIHPAKAQQPTAQKPLEIGDSVPGITLRNVVNHADSIIHPEEWKGKLVILSFWATWCSVCIDQFPKMAALQEEFKDQLLIIPVTQDDSVKVNRVLKASPTLAGIHLPFVTSTVLDHYFPHRLLPHEVWIDSVGRVVAVTGHQEVHAANILKFLESTDNRISTKKDITDAVHSKPFIAGGLGSYNLPSEKIKYSRMITSYIPGLGSFRSNVNKYDDRVTIKCTNVSIQHLFAQAIASSPHKKWPDHKDFYLMFRGRLVWEAKDSTLFYSFDKQDKYNRVPDSLRAFNYEIVLPRVDSARVNGLMLQDLNDYFGHHYNIVGSRENRMVDCWALICVDSTKLISKGGDKRITIGTDTKHISVSNASVDEFMFWWHIINPSIYHNAIPIINETGISSPIDLHLKVNPADFEAVKKAISAYGLEFRRVVRPMDMIVIRNKRQATSNL